MCEPTHSIVQIPSQDNNGTPVDARIEAAINRNEPPEEPENQEAIVKPKKPRSPAGAKKPKKEKEKEKEKESKEEKKPRKKKAVIKTHKIEGRYHFSKMGFGHSESMRITPIAWNLLPTPTFYEAEWWNRKVKMDGRFHGKEFDRELALSSAEEYADRVSIGSLSILRQFLAQTISRTDMPHVYIDCFRVMLSPIGKLELESKLKIADLVGKGKYSAIDFRHSFSIDRLIKVILGMTRDPKNLTSLWQPTGEDLLITPDRDVSMLVN